jgi:hypothetical protein
MHVFGEKEWNTYEEQPSFQVGSPRCSVVGVVVFREIGLNGIVPTQYAEKVNVGQKQVRTEVVYVRLFRY